MIAHLEVEDIPVATPRMASRGTVPTSPNRTGYTFNNLTAHAILGEDKDELLTNDGNMRVIRRKSRAPSMNQTLDVPYARHRPAAGAAGSSNIRLGPAFGEELPDFMRRATSIPKRRPAKLMTDVNDKQQTDSILVTDMNKYFCKRDQDLFKPLEPKIIQYKYPKTIGSCYAKNMRGTSPSWLQSKKKKTDQEDDVAMPSPPKYSPRGDEDAKPAKRMHFNNIATLRDSVKIPFEKPHMLKTHNSGQFANRKGSELVGSLSNEGLHEEGFRAAKPIGDLEKFQDITLKFFAESHNKVNFTDFAI